MKTTNIILTVLFAIFTVVQLNDPDPLLWVLIYGYTAVMFGLAAAGRYHRPLLLGGTLICLGWALWLLPAVFEWLSNHEIADIVKKMSANQVYIEESRESFGLLMAAAAMGWLYLQNNIG